MRRLGFKGLALRVQRSGSRGVWDSGSIAWVGVLQVVGSKAVGSLFRFWRLSGQPPQTVRFSRILSDLRITKKGPVVGLGWVVSKTTLRPGPKP